MSEPQTAKELLKVIEDFLLTAARNESWAAWAVLSALRGPDHTDVGTKAYTIEVRRKAFPTIAAHEDANEKLHWTAQRGRTVRMACFVHGEGQNWQHPPAPPLLSMCPYPKDTAVMGHFAFHIREAAQALEIINGQA